MLCDPFYRFYLEARGSGDYIRSWSSSGSKFTQAVVIWLESWRTVMHTVGRVETGDGSQGALTGEGLRPIIKIRSLEITNQH